MSKQIKSRQVRAKAAATAPATNDPARRFWLAGLGAFSIAQKRGNAVLETLVVEGKSFQKRSETFVRQLGSDVKVVVGARVKPVQQRLKAARRNAEATIEQGIGRALSWAGVPSKADVDALVARIDKLSRQLRTAK